MKQQTLSDMEYSCRKKKTKREEFLEIMDDNLYSQLKMLNRQMIFQKWGKFSRAYLHSKHVMLYNQEETLQG